MEENKTQFQLFEEAFNSYYSEDDEWLLPEKFRTDFERGALLPFGMHVVSKEVPTYDRDGYPDPEEIGAVVFVRDFNIFVEFSGEASSYTNEIYFSGFQEVVPHEVVKIEYKPIYR